MGLVVEEGVAEGEVVGLNVMTLMVREMMAGEVEEDTRIAMIEGEGEVVVAVHLQAGMTEIVTMMVHHIGGTTTVAIMTVTRTIEVTGGTEMNGGSTSAMHLEAIKTISVDGVVREVHRLVWNVVATTRGRSITQGNNAIDMEDRTVTRMIIITVAGGIVTTTGVVQGGEKARRMDVVM